MPQPLGGGARWLGRAPVGSRQHLELPRLAGACPVVEQAGGRIRVEINVDGEVLVGLHAPGHGQRLGACTSSVSTTASTACPGGEVPSRVASPIAPSPIICPSNLASRDVTGDNQTARRPNGSSLNSTR